MLTDDELGALMQMDEDRYKHLVVKLFQSGTATTEQWLALATCVYSCAEAGYINSALMATIDRWVLAQGEASHDSLP